jgi:hypothetical protein
MTDDQHGRRGPWAGCLAIGLLLALPAYVLSLGPVIALESHGWLPVEVEFIYFPLAILAEYCKPIDNAPQWYIGLWGG